MLCSIKFLSCVMSAVKTLKHKKQKMDKPGTTTTKTNKKTQKNHKKNTHTNTHNASTRYYTKCVPWGKSGLARMASSSGANSVYSVEPPPPAASRARARSVELSAAVSREKDGSEDRVSQIVPVHSEYREIRGRTCLAFIHTEDVVVFLLRAIG